MRLGGRLAAAIEVLSDISGRGRPAADALKDWGSTHRFAGSGDRAAIGNIVYDALRRKHSAGWLFDTDTPRSLAIGALLLEWGQSPTSLAEALEGDKFAPEPLSDAEIRLASSRKLADAPPEIRSDIPEWCVPLFQQAYGDRWVDEAIGLAARPPLDLRVNTLVADREKVLDELESIGAASTELAPNGIRIPPIDGSGRHPNVQGYPAFLNGWFEVQDEGSQIAAILSGAAEGMQVLDYCAGAGGKTLALSASMSNTGQIFAHDSDKARLMPIVDRLRRAGSRNVQVVARRQDLAALEVKMDLVLIDAPCTGSGTWRRRPDAKWRLNEKQLDVRLAEQQAILDTAKSFVRPGGRLAYVTCSVFPSENQTQIEMFLSRSEDFAPVDHEALWASAFHGRESAARVDPRLGISLSPARSGTDGFYFAAMERRLAT